MTVDDIEFSNASEAEKHHLVGREIIVKWEEEWVSAMVVAYYTEPNEFVDADSYKIVFATDHSTSVMKRREMKFRLLPRRSEEDGPILQGAVVRCKLDGEEHSAMVYAHFPNGEIYVAFPYVHDFATATISDGWELLMDSPCIEMD